MIKKILTITSVTVILGLLIMGPQLGKVSKKAAATTSNGTSSQTASVSTSGSNIKVPTTGSVSTYDVPSIKLPDGSELKLPSYTPTSSTSSSSSSNGTTTTGPDASVCASAQAAISQIQNAYAAQNQPLQAEINNYQSIITNDGKNYAARGSGPTPDEQVYDQKVLVALQNDQNKLSYNLQQMNGQLVPYQQQVITNCH